MERAKVVIASLLKPIDDTRMFEKFGLSLAKTNKYEVNIIGFASKNIKPHKSITVHPIGPFGRLSFARGLAPFRVYRLYLKLKPQLIIVNTHEILIVTTLYKILFGSKVIYDIRENYARNIRRMNGFTPVVRPLLSAWIRFKEWLSLPFVNRQIIAESTYRHELPFLKKSAVLLENKYNPPESALPSEKKNTAYKSLLYSGTIASSYGIFEAIAIAKKLYQTDPGIQLTIIGYCSIKGDLLRLKSEIEHCDFIRLIGGDYLVPHIQIIKEIKKADFGMLMNRSNPSTDRKLPTRLFEYTANQLPVLCINNPVWIDFLKAFNAVIPVRPADFDPEKVIDTMTNGTFYDRGNPETSLWRSEEPRLLQLVESVL